MAAVIDRGSRRIMRLAMAEQMESRLGASAMFMGSLIEQFLAPAALFPVGLRAGLG